MNTYLPKRIVVNSNNSRFFAILMAFSGGVSDVYCHIYFHGLVATQTGNVILLASDLSQKNWSQVIPKLLSILTFSLGFLAGIWIKEKNDHYLYWRSYTMIPVVIASLLIPFAPYDFHLLKLCSLAFGTGLLMLTFTGVRVEKNQYTIMMTSGNYRRMLTEWYYYLTSKNKSAILKRNAENYTIVVISFLTGVCLLAIVNLFWGPYTIWLASITFFLAFMIEFSQASRNN